MKIFLCKTPEVSPELMEEVLDILNCCPGELVFSYLPMEYDYEKLPFLKYFEWNVNYAIASKYRKQDFIQELGPPLSWREFFWVCDAVREHHELAEEDIVICLSNRRNSLNYFSMFDIAGGRNAFVTCSDWENFLHSNPVFPIAFEVVANMLQLMGWHHLENAADLKNYHDISIGCFNDYCVNKTEIILKLRTGDICHKCIQHMLTEGVKDEVIIQSLEIFERIRKELMFSQGFRGTVRPRKLEVIGNRTILIEDKELALAPLQKTLFIFFLKHPEGVRVVDLQDHEEELFAIYEHIKGNAEPRNISELVKPIDGTFNYNKSRLNRDINTKLGKDLGAFYTVNGKPSEEFRIALPQEFVNFREAVCA